MTLANYKTRADDKLHINFSGLKRCTSPGATLSLVRELAGDKTPYDGDIVQFGRLRHEAWEKEGKATGRIPADFQHIYNTTVDFAEQPFAVEVFKDVVLHFRPDAVSLADEAIIDYKKIVGSGRQFLTSKQLYIYAYGLQLYGYKISKRVYLCERWNKEGTEILGYQKFEIPLTLADMGMVPKWIKERAQLLLSVSEAYEKTKE